MSEQTGKKVWDKWMEELTPPYTVSYNPSGILYAKERIAKLEAKLEALESRNRDMQNRVDHYLNYAKRIEKENKALKEAAMAVVKRKWIHNGTTCVPESDLDALAALIKEKDDVLP